MNKKILSDIIKIRFAARKTIDEKINCCDEIRQLERQRQKFSQEGVSFILLDKRIETLEAHNKELFDFIAEIGKSLCVYLDEWQQAGATFRDLCDLCAIPYGKAVQKVSPGNVDKPFSELIFIYNLDYKHNDGDWIEWEVDGPFTHCIKEYHRHLMVTTPGLMDAMRHKLFEFFPEIEQSMVRQYTDADGETRYIDADGVELNG